VLFNSCTLPSWKMFGFLCTFPVIGLVCTNVLHFVSFLLSVFRNDCNELWIFNCNPLFSRFVGMAIWFYSISKFLMEFKLWSVDTNCPYCLDVGVLGYSELVFLADCSLFLEAALSRLCLFSISEDIIKCRFWGRFFRLVWKVCSDSLWNLSCSFSYFLASSFGGLW
jgi:hypothetical protein